MFDWVHHRPGFVHNDQIGPSVHRARFQFMGIILPVLALADGLLITGGGDKRWVGGALERMMTLFPGASTWWGGTLVIMGANLLWATAKDTPVVIWAASWGCALWYFCALWFSLGQLYETPSEVGNIGWVHYTVLAILFVLHGESRRRPVEPPVSAEKE